MRQVPGATMEHEPQAQLQSTGAQASGHRDGLSGGEAVAHRRLVEKLLSYWEEKRGTRPQPSLQDIDPEEIPELWPHCFILDVANFRDFPYFHYLGPRLARYSGIFLSGRYDWSRTLLKKSVCHYEDALARRAPVLLEEELIQYDNTKLLFRSILLPLSDDGTTINYLLGAANGTIRED